jgi:hypothetical protein
MTLPILRIVPPAAEAAPRPKRTEAQKAKRREADRARRAIHREQVLRQQRDASARWSAKHPDKKREKNKAWSVKKRAEDPRYFADNGARYRARHADAMPEMVRRGNIRRYGITVDDYDRMLVAQNGVCAICRQPCLTGKRLAVDHDHATGKVRGLLCSNCNQGLGHYCDEPVLLRAAADYVERSK